MLAKPISFDSDMRWKHKYQTGWMTFSNTSASNQIKQYKRFHWLSGWRKCQILVSVFIEGKGRSSISSGGSLCNSLLYLFSYSLHSPGALRWKKCQMIMLLRAPSGSSCTYSSHHISHFPANQLHYSSTLYPLFCRREVQRRH